MRPAGGVAYFVHDGKLRSPNPLCALRSQTPTLRLSGSTEPVIPSLKGGVPNRFLSYPRQYVWLAISIDPVYIDTGNWIESAAGLCYECLNDIALDVFGMTGNDHDFEDADPLELAEIKRRWKPYIGQLPEYAYLCDELLSRSK